MTMMRTLLGFSLLLGAACSDDGLSPQAGTGGATTGSADQNGDDTQEADTVAGPSESSTGSSVDPTGGGTSTGLDGTGTGPGSTSDATADGSEGDGTGSGSGSSSGSDTAGTTACMPISEDPSAIGDDCEIGAGECPAGYTCQGMSGIVFQSLCEIICEEDCDCPEAHSCQMMQDKAGMWMQCNPD